MRKIAKQYSFKRKKWNFSAPPISFNDYRIFYKLYEQDNSNTENKNFDKDKFDDLIRHKHRKHLFTFYTSSFLSFTIFLLEAGIPEDYRIFFLMVALLYIFYMSIIYNNTKKD